MATGSNSKVFFIPYILNMTQFIRSTAKTEKSFLQQISRNALYFWNCEKKRRKKSKDWLLTGKLCPNTKTTEFVIHFAVLKLVFCKHNTWLSIIITMNY